MRSYFLDCSSLQLRFLFILSGLVTSKFRTQIQSCRAVLQATYVELFGATPARVLLQQTQLLQGLLRLRYKLVTVKGIIYTLQSRPWFEVDSALILWVLKCPQSSYFGRLKNVEHHQDLNRDGGHYRTWDLHPDGCEACQSPGGVPGIRKYESCRMISQNWRRRGSGWQDLPHPYPFRGQVE